MFISHLNLNLIHIEHVYLKSHIEIALYVLVCLFLETAYSCCCKHSFHNNTLEEKIVNCLHPIKQIKEDIECKIEDACHHVNTICGQFHII